MNLLVSGMESMNLLCFGRCLGLLDERKWPANLLENQGLWMLLAIIALVAAAVFLGNWIARSFRSADHGWKISTVLSSVCVAAVIIIFGSGTFQPIFEGMARQRLTAANPDGEEQEIEKFATKAGRPGLRFRLGVDLRGGYTLVGELNDQEVPPGESPIEVQQIIPQLMERVDPSGTLEIAIRAMGPNRLEVTIPDADKEEAERIWKRLTETGQLLFRIVARQGSGEDQGNTALISQAETQMKNGNFSEFVTRAGSDEVIGRWYKIARVRNEDGTLTPDAALKYIPNLSNYVRSIEGTTVKLVDLRTLYNDLGLADISDDGVGSVLGQWMQKFRIDDLEVLMVEPERDSDYDVRGDHLAGVSPDYGKRGDLAISFRMNREGSKRLSRLTGRYQGESLGIVLEGNLHSAPNINEIISTSGIIEGKFTRKEVEDMVTTLNSGKIDVAFNKNPISKDYQFSSVGEQMKNQGLFAIGVSFVLVIGFMLFYYRFAGIIACAALLMNLLFIAAMVMLLKQPLTLTGLAGIVLTVGMSVDANVLIFERIREELSRGASLRMAIRNGFDRATVTIIDANVTTLITAVVLYVIGNEQIKGFSITLILGILMSMYTAIFFARIVFEIFERRGILTKLGMMQVLTKSKFDFMGKKSMAATVSMVIILIGFVGVFVRQSQIFDHDLRGGSTARVVFPGSMTISDVRDELDKANIQFQNEKVTFDASELQSDEEFADKLYVRIDSDLPLQEDQVAEGEEGAPKLDEVLTEIFGDKLLRTSVEVEDLKVTPTGSARRSRDSGIGSKLMQLAASASANPQLALAGLLTAGNQETAGEPGAQEGSESGADSPASGSPDTQPTQPAQTSDGTFLASVTMKFGFPTTRSNVISGLVEMADSMDIPLSERNVTVNGGAEDIGEPKFKTKEWEVKIERLADEDVANRLIAAYSEQINGTPYFPTLSGVGGQIAGRTQWQALAAIFASLVGIIGYVWIRFQNIAFGLAAVVALIHDVLVVLSAIAVSYFLSQYLGIIDNFKISLPVIAAFLTIIGYSLNDTIVVFDRIREVRGKRSEITADMLNESISQTLSRTILTSLTTFIVVFILFLLGGEAIHGFAFALVVGVLVGTYSSIFVASPVLLWLMNRTNLGSLELEEA